VLRKTLRIMAGTAIAFPALAVAAAHPVACHAPDTCSHASRVQLAGDVFVERFELASGGRTARVLERAEELHPGDRLVFVVSWSGGDPNGFVVTNPVPRSVVWKPGSGDAIKDVSVDGGRTWGALAGLMLNDTAGWRPALPADATHVRWCIPASRAVGTGVVPGVAPAKSPIAGWSANPPATASASRSGGAAPGRSWRRPSHRPRGGRN
jgi:hypothetical protein